MEIAVATYYFDTLRLMFEYILEIYIAQSIESYANVLVAKSLKSQYFYHKMSKKPSQFQKLGVVKELSD